MSNQVIRVQNISKRYRLGLKEKQAKTFAGQITNVIKAPWQNLKRLRAMSKFDYEDESVFWALKDIDFEVKEGEVLGVIGKNGAGKSTLLKILSQITDPSYGRIEIHGRVASLLEVGTGFHPELSGRENIYMNGTILGMTRREIDSKLDEIIDFSGVEKFIDTAVKFYSSGMKVRLGFSVAAHLEPEILIIDEVLAVGDYEFQKKCLGKMEDVSRNEGRTIIFVSHDLNSVKRLCDNTIILKNGIIHSLGKTNDVVELYMDSNYKEATKWVGFDGDNSIQIVRTQIITNPDNSFFIDSSIQVEIELNILNDYPNLVIGFNLLSEFGEEIARSNYNDFIEDMVVKKGLYIFKFIIPEYTLAVGTYLLKFDIAIPFVAKINSEKINLSFNLLANKPTGNVFNLTNSRQYNSQIRQNWFLTKEKLS